MKQIFDQRPWLPLVLCLFAGPGITLSLAPFDAWPLGLVALGLLFYCCLQQRQRLTSLSFCFGLGLFGSGASWVYVSIHDFGMPSVPLAAGLTALFIAVLASALCLPFWGYQWLLKKLRWQPSSIIFLLGLCATYSLSEWIRGWLFSGFPWLYSGYAYLATPIASWASFGGVLLLSLISCLTAAAVVAVIAERNPASNALLLSLVAIWLTGPLLAKIQWTQSQGEKITVGMVQANIPQHLKWQPSFRQNTLDRYWQMSQPLWGKDWLIWPEAAIPIPYHRAKPYFDRAAQAAKQHNTALISGVIYDQQQPRQFYNSAIGLGLAEGVYHKRHLVPFGEYIPLASAFGQIFKLFNLATPGITPGPKEGQTISLIKQGFEIQPLICYEVVYPLLGRQAANHPVLLTISNDAWFGNSLGPLQHLQMAQMRALEHQRYMIRSTNNGISAIINPKGELIAVSEQFKQQNLTGEVWAKQGKTPFGRYGNSLFLLLVAALILASSLGRNGVKAS